MKKTKIICTMGPNTNDRNAPSALSMPMSAESAASRSTAAPFLPGTFPCSLSPHMLLIPSTMAKAAAAVISMTLYFLSFTLYPFLSSRVQDQAFFNSPVPFSISASLSFAYPSMTVDG